MFYVGKTLIDRVIGRFALVGHKTRDFMWALAPVIYPVTDVDKLLTTPVLSFSGNKDLSGSGNVTVWTVPVGKRWRLKAWWREGTTGASALVLIQDATHYLNIAPFQTASNSNNADILLDAGATLGLAATGNGGDTARTACIAYEEEDAF